jgi:choline/glycine/proline betaine transport protein
LAEAVQNDLARSLFIFLELLPGASQIAVPDAVIFGIGALATLAIITFFVTSSESGSLVIDIITAGGKPNPPTAQRVYWAVLEGVVAAVLLVGGGLTALQTAAISAGLPFALLILAMIFAVHRALRADETRSVRISR